MVKSLIEGYERLQGEIPVHGAKNSTLSILAASMFCNTETVLHNCSVLSDAETCVKIPRYLRCRVTRSDRDVTIDSSGASHSDIPDYLMREMRSSIVFLGAITARAGHAKLSFPGGCELGPRPIDLYLTVFYRMGAEIGGDRGCLDCSAPDGLKGAKIGFPSPNIGVTENTMIATVCIKGTTVITNVAREPEICNLANFLNVCGVKIHDAGESTIVIEGAVKSSGCEHSVTPDRTAAATYMVAAAVVGSILLTSRIDPRHLEPMTPVFEESGCGLMFCEDEFKITTPQWPQPVKNVRTTLYPRSSTDMQTPVMAMAVSVNGISVFVESIFESRCRHVGEFLRLGANIKVEGRVAVVQGVSRLSGASAESPDLRGGAILVIVGLAVEGITQVEGLWYIDRGYEQMELSLAAVGTSIRRID